MKSISLSNLQISMLMALFSGQNGFMFSYPTGHSLVRRGLIESDKGLRFRLTPYGVKVCIEFTRKNK